MKNLDQIKDLELSLSESDSPFAEGQLTAREVMKQGQDGIGVDSTIKKYIQMVRVKRFSYKRSYKCFFMYKNSDRFVVIY